MGIRFSVWSLLLMGVMTSPNGVGSTHTISLGSISFRFQLVVPFLPSITLTSEDTCSCADAM